MAPSSVLWCHVWNDTASKTKSKQHVDSIRQLQLPEPSIGFRLTIYDRSQFATTEMDSCCWGAEVCVLTEPSHSFTCYVTLLKWPLKHCHPPTLTTCLLGSLSRHIVATLSYLCLFFFLQMRLLRWNMGLDHWCQREGLMVCVLCTVYKSISDGSVWILATFNLIKWKHGEKSTGVQTTVFLKTFPSCSCSQAHTHTTWNPFHDGLSTEISPKEKESKIALCGSTEKGEQHRKKNLIYEGLAVFYIGVSVSW